MKFEFDSNNATELRAVEAAVAVLVGGLTPERQILDSVVAKLKDWSDDGQPAIGSGAVEKIEVAEVAKAFNVPVEVLKDLPGAVVSDDGQTVTGSGEAETIRVDTLEPIPAAEELDSADQPWDAELHSSSRAKVADGTWKKKRGARSVETLAKESGLTQDEVAARLAEPLPPTTNNGEFTAEHLAAVTPPAPPVPPAPAVPTPPAPQADGLVTMNDIWALITNGKTTINVVLAAAQRMGFADLGKVAQTATAEQRAALLKELTA